MSGRTLVKQVEHYTDYDKRLIIAQKFIQGASANIYRNLRYYNGRGKDLQLYMKDIDDYRKNILIIFKIQYLKVYLPKQS